MNILSKFGFILGILLFATACSAGSSGDDFPNKDIEIVAPATPGGGWDTTARATQKTLEDEGLVDENMNVENKPGGSGEVGFSYMKEKDAHTLAVNSSLLLTNNLLGQSDLTYEDFTPLATLTNEWVTLATPKGSDLESLDDVMKELKKDPKSLKIGVAPGLGSDEHLAFVQAALKNDIDPSELDFIVYDSGGDQLSAIVGDHVDVAAMYVSEVTEQYQGDKLNILATASEERTEELEDVPTWKEEGVDVVFPHWRGIMGPPDMDEDEKEYWESKIKKMTETDQWKEVLENNEWEDFYKDSEETEKFLEEQNQEFKELLNESDLLE